MDQKNERVRNVIFLWLADQRCFRVYTFYSMVYSSNLYIIEHIILQKCLYQVRVITVFTVFRLTDFVCLYNYEFGLSLCKIVRSSVILLLPLCSKYNIINGLSYSIHLNLHVEWRGFCPIIYFNYEMARFNFTFVFVDVKMLIKIKKK